MDRIEYSKHLIKHLEMWQDAIEYEYQNNIGLLRDINLCIINLTFSGYKINKNYE